MSWLVVDGNGIEYIYSSKPERNKVCVTGKFWTLVSIEEDECYISLPPGFIRKLIGRDLTWDDEPVEIPDNF